MPWLTTGPLYFRDRLNDPPPPGQYPTGDQVSFVDPFTGTGILAALVSGAAAGQAAAIGRSPIEYLEETARRLRPALRVSAIFRWAIEAGVADRLLRWIPSSWLVGWTRPR
jgi:flavin-dependent dehydrogenase